jgi:cytochrome c biogenesis protein CcmG/thiol:disulfide interchange protein DsbE
LERRGEREVKEPCLDLGDLHRDLFFARYHAPLQVPVNDEMEQEGGSRLRVVTRVAFVLVPALLIAVLAVAVLRSGKTSLVGAEVPDFELPRVTGRAPLSSKDLAGSPAVVNFFASWCVPCKTEAPILERTWRQNREKGLVVLGINIQDTEEDARDFVTKYGITYPVIRDVNQEVANQFGVTGIPETFFIDHRWKFAAIGTRNQIGSRGQTVVYGAISSALLNSQVELLLERVPAPSVRARFRTREDGHTS